MAGEDKLCVMRVYERVRERTEEYLEQVWVKACVDLIYQEQSSTA